MYTMKHAGFVVVLHAFQKKSTKGIKTPRRHMDLVMQRAKEAREQFDD